MGQYFKPLNLDRREFICPWCIGGGAKLWEWAANPQGAIFTLLLRKSNQLGGGDIGFTAPIVDESDDEDSVSRTLQLALAREGAAVNIPSGSIVGRWAEDRVLLIGDYDSSELYDESRSYTNISKLVVDEWNDFIGLESLQLTFNDNCSCWTDEE